MAGIPETAYVLIIGAMKSGTTSLYSYIVQHPEICPCKVKEPEYFSRHQSHAAHEDRYEELWDFNGDVHKMVLEGSTGYTKYPLEENVPERISEYGIRPKFLYLLRDPYERIESHYNSARFNPDWEGSILDEHLINVSNYYMQLERFRQFFDTSSILLLDFSRLKESPDQVLISTFDFLGLEPYLPESYRKENVTRERTKMEILYDNLLVRTGLHRYMPGVMKMLGRKAAAKTRPIERKLLTEENRNKVYKLLKDDMKKLRSEYGFNTEQWGFD